MWETYYLKCDNHQLFIKVIADLLDCHTFNPYTPLWNIPDQEKNGTIVDMSSHSEHKDEGLVSVYKSVAITKCCNSSHNRFWISPN